MATVTLMLTGNFKHEDFAGHKGVIGPGDLQWMTAGRGIVHCEVPQGDELSHGLQLWINLSKANKMVEPSYQELLSKDIPHVEKNGVKVRVISGKSMGIESPVISVTPTMYLQFSFAPSSTHTQEVPPDWNVFLYTISGDLFVGDDPNSTPAHHTITLTKGSFVQLTAGPKGAEFVLIGGLPLNEPVAHAGPFVMNTEGELRQTFLDYQMGKNGFERAPGWKSEAVRLDPDYQE